MRAEELKAVLSMIDPPPPAPVSAQEMAAAVLAFFESATPQESIVFLRFLSGLVASAFGGAKEKTEEVPAPAPTSKPAPVAHGFTTFGAPTLPPEIVRAGEPQKPEEATVVATPPPQPTPLPLFEEMDDVESYLPPNLPTN